MTIDPVVLRWALCVFVTALVSVSWMLVVAFRKTRQLEAVADRVPELTEEHKYMQWKVGQRDQLLTEAYEELNHLRAMTGVRMRRGYGSGNELASRPMAEDVSAYRGPYVGHVHKGKPS